MRDFKSFNYEDMAAVARSRNTTTFNRASDLIDSARVNASDTMREQGKGFEYTEEWQDMFKATLRSLLADETDSHVRGFFYRRGFYF